MRRWSHTDNYDGYAMMLLPTSSYMVYLRNSVLYKRTMCDLKWASASACHVRADSTAANKLRETTKEFNATARQKPLACANNRWMLSFRPMDFAVKKTSSNLGKGLLYGHIVKYNVKIWVFHCMIGATDVYFGVIIYLNLF